MHYQAQEQYTQAEPLHKRALTIRKKVLGLEHRDVAESLNNLALLYNNQGKLLEAEPLYKQALEILEKVLGSDNPYVLLTLNNLASLYAKQGRHAEAETLRARALQIKRKMETQSIASDKPSSLTGTTEKEASLKWRTTAMSVVPLKVVPKPLPDPVGRGRIIFNNPAAPVRDANPAVEYVCGSCSAPLLTDMDMIKFATIFPNSEVLVRCKECNAYNDATPPPTSAAR
jgi:tetratricopeptide (TPR) repeat protein